MKAILGLALCILMGYALANVIHIQVMKWQESKPVIVNQEVENSEP